MLEKERVSAYHLAMIKIAKHKIFLAVSLLLFMSTLLSAQDISSFPLSSDVYLHNVKVLGLKLLTKKKFFNDIYKLKFPDELKVNDLREAEKRTRMSGYFRRLTFTYQYKKDEKKVKGFYLTIKVVEQPVLVKIKQGGDFFTDLERLIKILHKNEIQAGKIFNKKKMETSLQLFKEYLQRRGIFLFNINYRIKSELQKTEHWLSSIFRINDKKNMLPVYLKLYILKITHFYIRDIEVVGNKSIKKETIIKHFPVKKGQLVSNNEQLYKAVWKLRRLGIFSSVLLDIVPLGALNKARIIIRVKEIESDIVNPSVSLNSREEFNLELDYFNYSIGENFARVSAGLIFDTRTEDFYFITQLSMPFLFDAYFFNLRLERTASSAPYDEDWDLYNEQLTFSITLGRRFSTYFSLYARIDNSRTDLYYHNDNSTEPALPAGLEKSRIFLDQTFTLLLMLDSLDDNFFPTRGVRSFLSFTTSTLSDFDFYSIIDNRFEWYIPLKENITMVFYEHAAYLFTSGTERTLSLESQRKTTAQDDSAYGLDQTKITVFGSVEFRYRFLEQFAAVVFGEAGAAWGKFKDVSFTQVSFGLGLGFRIAPRQHYYAHIFKYPWSFNIGFNISNKKDNNPFFSVVSSRDEYYYINLQASF